METNELTGQVIGCAIEVHKTLGPGLLESIYESCLCRELDMTGLPYKTQVPIAVDYKSWKLDQVFRIDFIVASSLLVEIKSVESLTKLHFSQTLTYLKLSGLKTALLINFDTPVLKAGIRRIKF